MSRRKDALRRLAPLLIVVAGFALFPLLTRALFPPELRTAMIELHEAPRTLPPLAFEDAAGGKHTLDEFRGRVVLLNFWATWCPPCKAEMPSLNALAAHFAQKDFVIVPVSVDASGRVSVQGYYADYKLDRLAIYIDPSMDAMHAVAVPGIPTSLLIDRDGREVGRLVGPAQWDSPAIVAGIADVIAR